jgi:hypothetical protein
LVAIVTDFGMIEISIRVKIIIATKITEKAPITKIGSRSKAVVENV